MIVTLGELRQLTSDLLDETPLVLLSEITENEWVPIGMDVQVRMTGRPIVEFTTESLIEGDDGITEAMAEHHSQTMPSPFNG